MKPLRKLAVGLGIAGIVLATAIPAAADPSNEPLTAAVQLYHDGHYSAAYGHLVKLADGGHPDAARIALLMVRFGPQLYGVQWSASTYQIARWVALASRNQPPFAAGSGAWRRRSW